MTTITIPKRIISDQNLVAVPNNLYEEFLVWQEMHKSMKTFHPTSSEMKAISLGRREILEGNYVTLEELNHELGNQYRRHRKEKS